VATGYEVAREIGKLTVNPALLAAYGRSWINKPGDGKFDQLMREFNEGGLAYNIINALTDLRRRSQPGTKKAPALERFEAAVARALPRAGVGPVNLAAVNGLVNKWNDLFNNLPAFIQYAALRQQGVSANDAAAYTLDMMNYYKSGEWAPAASALWAFFRPTIQGGANLIRTLDPRGKDRATRVRSAGAALGMTVMSLMITGLLRSMGGDDEKTGLNRYDQIPIDQLTRFIPLFNEDGSYLKLQLPFGGTQMFWGAGQIIDRVGRGLLKPDEGAYHLVMNTFKQVLPDSYPAYPPSEDPLAWVFQTFTPQPFRPLVDLKVDKNYWGRSINGVKDSTAPLYDQGRKTTPSNWHATAKWLHDTLGFETTPETLRYVFNYYLAGPLQGMMTALEADGLYQPPCQGGRLS
jgi:hypothetical protein